jgi:hypothetical protein
MNTPHTIPWTSDLETIRNDYDPAHILIKGPNGEQIGRAEYGRSDTERQANARLMIAAPDMHQLLKDIDNENGRHFHLDPDLAQRLRAILDT